MDWHVSLKSNELENVTANVTWKVELSHTLHFFAHSNLIITSVHISTPLCNETCSYSYTTDKGKPYSSLNQPTLLEFPSRWLEDDITQQYGGNVQVHVPAVFDGLKEANMLINYRIRRFAVKNHHTILSSYPSSSILDAHSSCLFPLPKPEHETIERLTTHLHFDTKDDANGWTTIFAAGRERVQVVDQSTERIFECDGPILPSAVVFFLSSSTFYTFGNYLLPSTISSTLLKGWTWKNPFSNSSSPTYVLLDEWPQTDAPCAIYHSFTLLSASYFFPRYYNSNTMDKIWRRYVFLVITIWSSLFAERPFLHQEDTWVLVGLAQFLAYEALPNLTDKSYVLHRWKESVFRSQYLFPSFLFHSITNKDQTPVSHFLKQLTIQGVCFVPDTLTLEEDEGLALATKHKIRDLFHTTSHYAAFFIYRLSNSHLPESSTIIHRIVQQCVTKKDKPLLEAEFFSILKSLSSTGFPEINSTSIQQWLPNLHEDGEKRTLEGKASVFFDEKNRRIIIHLLQTGSKVWHGSIKFKIQEIEELKEHERNVYAREHKWIFDCQTFKIKGTGGRANRSEENRTRAWKNIQNLKVNDLLNLSSAKKTCRFWKIEEPVRYVLFDPNHVWLSNIEWSQPKEHWMEILHDDVLQQDVELQIYVMKQVNRLEFSNEMIEVKTANGQNTKKSKKVTKAVETAAAATTSATTRPKKSISSDLILYVISYYIGMMQELERPEKVRMFALTSLVSLHERWMKYYPSSDIVISLVGKLYDHYVSTFTVDQTLFLATCVKVIVQCYGTCSSAIKEWIKEWMMDHFIALDEIDPSRESEFRLLRAYFAKIYLEWEEGANEFGKEVLIQDLQATLDMDLTPLEESDVWNKKPTLVAMKALQKTQLLDYENFYLKHPIWLGYPSIRLQAILSLDVSSARLVAMARLEKSEEMQCLMLLAYVLSSTKKKDKMDFTKLLSAIDIANMPRFATLAWLLGCEQQGGVAATVTLNKKNTKHVFDDWVAEEDVNYTFKRLGLKLAV
jgi:hypothetical protein